MSIATPSRFLLLCFLLATGGACLAQAEPHPGEASVVEMSAEQFADLVGTLQRLRTQRAQQLAAARPQGLPQANQPTPLPSAAAETPADDARLRALERETAALAEEVRRLRNQLDDAPREVRRDIPETRRTPRDDSQATAATDERLRRLEREFADERRRFERDLDEERERSRRLERELREARDREAYARSRDRDVNVTLPTAIPVPAGRPRIDTVVRTVEVGRSADSLLLRQQDSLQRALADLQREVQRRNRTDTVIVERATAPTIIRDTVRSTQVVTRTVVEDRVDLAAVLFANASSQLDAQAQAQVQQALEAYRRESDATLLLRGFASKSGSAAANQALSTRRAAAVRERLISLGVPATQIRIIGNGVDEGTSPTLARRVEIQLLRKPN